MQTSVARRQRNRRNGAARRSGGGSTGRRVAIALPLLLFGSFLVLGLFAMVAVVGAYSSFSRDLPDPKAMLESIDLNQETVVYDRTGKVELARFAVEQRQVVDFKDIPPVMVDATTSVEDKTFWENAGFDPLGIISAAIDTLRGNERGASTITQQLVRARLLPPSAFTGSRYERKIKEIIQSVRLTQEYRGSEGKERIMALYLNQNFYGNSSYGIKAAARSYFGITDLSKLTLAQAAILAAIPQSPSEYDLVKNAVKGEDGRLVVPPDSPIVQRRNFVLDLMKTRSFLTAGQYTAADYDKAMQDPVVLAPQATPRWRAPHFVWQVRRELGKILCGPDSGQDCNKIDIGGYRVVTTLDWKMQQVAEKWSEAAGRGPVQKDPAAYYRRLKVPYRPWLKNLEGRGVNNAALDAIDYRTGQVLAYTGSAGYYLTSTSKQFQPQFDVLSDGWRQPGSAFKPINYITGIEDHTLTAATLFMDVVTDFGGGWTPTDADRLERGPLRLREALQVSLNIPSIKAAAYNGVDHVIETARRFGIRFESPNPDVGLSVAIGTAELHIADLVGAFGAIADGGTLVPRTTILSVTDPQGNKIWPPDNYTPKPTKVVSSQAAYVVTNILASNTDPAQNPFWSERRLTDANGVRRPATLKTGTTDSTIDLTAVGYIAPPDDPTKYAIVAGAWMGNSDNSAPPEGVVSLESAASLWQEFMNEVTRTMPIADFVRPPGIVDATIDAQSGMKPGPFTTKTISEIFIDGTQPTQVDDTKYPVEIDSDSGLLWQEGCVGPKETKGFLDLSKVESAFPTWQPYNQGWIDRASHGTGVRGGPEKTATSYFYQTGGWTPFGATWGAPFAPTKTCEPAPTPSTEPFPSDFPFPSDSFQPFPFPSP